ncbi:MAG: hypothetical protein ABI637_08105 [Gemmatimonadota bacterium]
MPLCRVLAAASGCESCGAWIQSPAVAARLIATAPGTLRGSVLLLHRDLGVLIRRVPLVVVCFQGSVAAVPSRVLALGRMLEIVTRAGDRPSVTRLGDRSPELVLAERRAAGDVVRASRIRYELAITRAVRRR